MVQSEKIREQTRIRVKRYRSNPEFRLKERLYYRDWYKKNSWIGNYKNYVAAHQGLFPSCDNWVYCRGSGNLFQHDPVASEL